MTETLLWSERIVAFAVALQALELLMLRRHFSERGIWRWSELRRDYEGWLAPLGMALGPLLAERGFVALLVATFVGALLLGAGVTHPVLLGALALSTLLISLRFRGSFNGGSDAMTFLVLATLAVARAFEVENPRIASAALGYLVLQLTLSYFVSGAAKLARPEWRKGSALTMLAVSQGYSIPGSARAILSRPQASIVLGWGVVLFETAFPLALSSVTACQAFLAAAFVFHLANAWVFGLNRFVWAWASAYPALLWCVRALADA